MVSARIVKTVSAFRDQPNWPGTATARAEFSWAQIAEELGVNVGPANDLENATINIAELAVGRHARGARAQHVALRLLASDGNKTLCTYAELDALSNQLANAYTALGVSKGSVVFVLLGRQLELYVACLAAWKCGAVVAPLYTAFGPEPIATRVTLGQGEVLVTTSSIYARKVQIVAGQLSTLRQVLLVPDADTDTELLMYAATHAQPPLPVQLHNYASLIAAHSAAFTSVATRANTPSLLHFTSGTTGTPKGAQHVHGAVLQHYASAKFALDLKPYDVYWCTADPGWVTGMSYGVVAPLVHGLTLVVNAAEFDAAHWYTILQKEQISVWYTAPTALRLLIKAGLELARRYPFPNLRFIASVGEALNAGTVLWAQQAFGLPVHDNWWQTETGAIMLANTLAEDIKPGAIGHALPGIETALVQRIGDDELRFIDDPQSIGELAIKRGWPSMFRGYLAAPERYQHCIVGDWYLSGDLMRRDDDGYYWFVGRKDDQIKSAGHLIGPFEIESVLLEHSAVAEAAVIGKPDVLIGESIKGFVSLKHGIDDSDILRRDLLAHCRRKLGPALAPREITVLAQLPRTRSGKLLRRLLKARELGQPEGDLSMLEGGA